MKRIICHLRIHCGTTSIREFELKITCDKFGLNYYYNIHTERKSKLDFFPPYVLCLILSLSIFKTLKSVCDAF